MYRNLLATLSASMSRSHASRELKWMRESLCTEFNGTLTPESVKTLEDMVSRRARGEPLQYILGSQPFGPLDLIVRPPTLIPRPETEDWTIRLAGEISPTKASPITMLDLCTGSGCIPLLLNYLWPSGSNHAICVDVSQDALNLAHENAVRCGISVEFANEGSPTSTKSASILLLLDDVLRSNFPERLANLGEPSFDLITANPPYIPLAEYVNLNSTVKMYEDHRALLGDPNHTCHGEGLSFYRAFATQVRRYDLLKDCGMIVLEVGENQSDEVQRLMLNDAKMQRTAVWRDPWGKERVVVAWKSTG
ncbi:S-adenosyl-L-methionine-dependent methyltransferase [Rickenella mellea]|uniref:S-adenosyl-L-methionine-dependent methyltransferase n=1 Tax=Rickenella mellea TaxID=50990 RepID=A0A4Y7QGC8_9AGAM|nr:S-adenosyl-L-methionine-dependent methyltransferase [Rickenella mellea]